MQKILRENPVKVGQIGKSHMDGFVVELTSDHNKSGPEKSGRWKKNGPHIPKRKK